MSVLLLLLLSAPSHAQESPPAPPDAAEGGEVTVGILGTLIGDGSSLFGVLEARPVGGPVGGGDVDVAFDGDRDVLTVTNGTVSAITFAIDLTKADNVAARPALPFETVLEPGASATVRFESARKGKMTYSYRWGWKAGSSAAIHRPEGLYRLPWPSNLNFECTQSFNGKYSHDNEHAMDIVMPVGTPILAARAGRVIRVVDGWGEGGPDRAYLDEANSVRVLHRDGTYADYLHLLAGGIAVEVGDEVKVGQELAKSGNSGFSKRPHLHFVVKSALDAWAVRTWPVQFDVDGTALTLGPKKWYPHDP